MKFTLPLLLWLSSLLAGTAFIVLGFAFLPLVGMYAGGFVESNFNEDEIRLILYGWPLGMKLLGGLLVLFSSVLYIFLRKKLSTRAYTGIFAVVVLVNVLAVALILPRLL